MKTGLLASTLLMVAFSLSFGQEKPDSLLQTSSKHLEFKKALGAENRRFRKKELDYRDFRIYKYSKYIFYLDDKPYEALYATRLMKSNVETDKLFQDGLTKFDKAKKINNAGVATILGGELVAISYFLLTKDFFGYYSIEVLAFLTLIVLVTDYTLVYHSGLNHVRKATAVYNAGLSPPYYLPKPELTFGFIGNGIGMRINF